MLASVLFRINNVVLYVVGFYLRAGGEKLYCCVICWVDDKEMIDVIISIHIYD